MRNEQLSHAHWSAQIDFDLSGEINQVSIQVEVNIAHHPGIIEQDVQIREATQHLLMQLLLLTAHR